MSKEERAILIKALQAIQSALSDVAAGNLGDLDDLRNAIHQLASEQ